MYTIYQPTVLLSCKEKMVLRFDNSQYPLTINPEPNACNGFVKIVDSDNKIICSNSDYSKVYQDEVKIPCTQLRGKKGQSLNIYFETYSDIYGNSTGQVNLTYGRG